MRLASGSVCLPEIMARKALPPSLVTWQRSCESCFFVRDMSILLVFPALISASYLRHASVVVIAHRMPFTVLRIFPFRASPQTGFRLPIFPSPFIHTSIHSYAAITEQQRCRVSLLLLEPPDPHRSHGNLFRPQICPHVPNPPLLISFVHPLRPITYTATCFILYILHARAFLRSYSYYQ